MDSKVDIHKNIATVSCLCGNVSETVHLQLRQDGHDYKPSVILCDCPYCRHLSGLLVISYHQILTPSFHDQHVKHLHAFTTPENLQVSSCQQWTSWFCAKCGCHVFRQRRNSEGSDDWEVATGTIIQSAEMDTTVICQPATSERFDGILSRWLRVFPGDNRGDQELLPVSSTNSSDVFDVLQGACACSKVRIRVSRPTESDFDEENVVKRHYADLIKPFKTTAQSEVMNQLNEKWWLRRDSKTDDIKYMAGTCACRSCRLTSGFEIQTWAFIPQNKIQLLDDAGWHDLDLNPDMIGALQSDTMSLHYYESSPDVFRYFCSSCGATVFWSNKTCLDLIDVSVGLFQTDTGALAEDWLEWWKTRVSFSEDVGLGRSGWSEVWARSLISRLEVLMLGTGKVEDVDLEETSGVLGTKFPHIR